MHFTQRRLNNVEITLAAYICCRMQGAHSAGLGTCCTQKRDACSRHQGESAFGVKIWVSRETWVLPLACLTVSVKTVSVLALCVCQLCQKIESEWYDYDMMLYLWEGLIRGSRSARALCVYTISTLAYLTTRTWYTLYTFTRYHYKPS